MTHIREDSSIVSSSDHHSQSHHQQQQQTPRSTARACQFCRKRKIKCDALKPACTTCRSSNRTCSYHHGPVKPRPSTALLNAAREEKNELERMLVRLKRASTAREREALLGLVDVVNGKVHIRAPTEVERARNVLTGEAVAAEALVSMPTSEAAAAGGGISPSNMAMAVDPDLARHAGYPTPSGSRTRETASEDCAVPLDHVQGGRKQKGDEDHDEEDEDDDDDDDDSEDEDNNDNDDDDTIHVLPFEKRQYMGVLVPPTGPTFSLNNSQAAHAPPPPPPPPPPALSAAQETLRYQLIANAAMSRQQEYRLRLLPTIRGVPGDLALHLLDLHWNRQHHTYLLTYRPAFMRELVDGGNYCTDFLLYAVFACASKFSERIELRTDPADPETTGQDFFRRCEEIITRDAVLSQSRIPTIVGLLLLGSTYNARGLTSKGWLYTGYALRMVFDLGLHIETERSENHNPLTPGEVEDVEIRRRVFWGAFICEKLQSVYLGRPATIQLRDAHVSRDFLDTFEELEPWAPYVDPQSHTDATSMAAAGGRWNNAVTHSVSVFQQLCLLAKIMTNIINKIYFAPAASSGAQVATPTASAAAAPTSGSASPRPRSRRKMRRALRQIDNALVRWYRELPPHLVYEPWAVKGGGASTTTATPNLTILHTTYHCLVILLHCPFISAGTTTSSTTTTATTAAASSAHGEEATTAWKRCTTAARNITNLALAYRATYPLRKSNYMLSYAVYVACTIHVHNAAAVFGVNNSENSATTAVEYPQIPPHLGSNTTTASDPSLLLRASLVCLDELAVPNSGAADTARIIRKLMAAKGIPEHLGGGGGGGGGGGLVANTNGNTGNVAGNVVDAAAAHFFAGQHDMTSPHSGSGHVNHANGINMANDTVMQPAPPPPANPFDDTNFAWQLFDESPAFDPLAQLQSFSDFGLSGHDLLFGFMDGNFSPSEFMGAS
ncbi:hypothetical protein SBRCBS47491_006811 [Sporothrix bragantina]|uniref:Zn(2)-C6 fungal-type domain-containing protein n=1 Tax=Sporothrix bragantina TaxID=671064 RepID=A0ABP0C969_9PEZI